MKALKKLMQYILISLATIVGIIVLGTLLFVWLSPQMGQAPKGKDLERIQTSINFKDKKFINLQKTELGDTWEAMKKMPEMFSKEGNEPTEPLPSEFQLIKNTVTDSTYVTWYGHSAFLLTLKEQRVLIDPMFGDYASPIPFGSKRYTYANEIPIDAIVPVDVVLFSHDHYDHLDYPTIKKIKDKVGVFLVPLGLGSHLKRWDVPAEKIIELDWWQTHTLNGITYTATPARHFSGRGLTDRDATQWAGWSIKTNTKAIYYSGDSGYGDHFKMIGEKLGPFDFALMECGQYNETWAQIHMMPEESVAASLDVGAKVVLPVHWGAFRLAPHSWTDSVERFSKEAQTKGLAYVTPTIGERLNLSNLPRTKAWWR